jgi:hypothetical protein
MAEEWRRVSLQGVGQPYGTIFFAGSMTEYADGRTNNRPEEGWTQLWQGANFDPTGRTVSDMDWSTNITEDH